MREGFSGTGNECWRWRKPRTAKCRKSVMCFVIHIAKESKLRDSFNDERSSNVITFSVTICIGLQSCFFSFSISSYITVKNGFTLFSWWFLLVFFQGHTEGIFWSSCTSPTSCVLLSKPVAKLKYHKLHYSTHILLINKETISCSSYVC